MPKILEDDTIETEKADLLVKMLVLAQFLWYGTSLVTWWESLPPELLETVILALTSCSVLTYIAAWKNPTDVQPSYSQCRHSLRSRVL